MITKQIDPAVVKARAEVRAAVEEWFSNVSLADLFAVKGWTYEQQQVGLAELQAMSPDEEPPDGEIRERARRARQRLAGPPPVARPNPARPAGEGAW